MNHNHWKENEWSRPIPDDDIELFPDDQIEVTDPNSGPETQEPEANLEDSEGTIFSKLQAKISDQFSKAMKNLPVLPEFDGFRETFVSQQENIKDLYTKLSSLEEYASAYSNTSQGLWQGGKVPFVNLITGSSGVTLVDGGMVLNDFGMWRINSQIWVDTWVINTGSVVSWEINVYRPSGELYHRKRGKGRYHDSDFSLPLETSFTTPTAGYRVEVSISNIAPGRGILGGEDRTSLTAHHINRVPADRPNV